MKIIMEPSCNKNEAHWLSVSLEMPDDQGIEDVMEALRGALIAYGFHAESIIRGAEYLVDEYSDEETKELSE